MKKKNYLKLLNQIKLNLHHLYKNIFDIFIYIRSFINV
jgi:hypothetical protein